MSMGPWARGCWLPGDRERSLLSNLLRHSHDILGHAGRGSVDHLAVELGSALALSRRRLQRVQNPACPGYLRLGRREYLVRQRDLRGMDGPLTLDTECRPPPCRREVGV